MGDLEPVKEIKSHELGIVVEALAKTKELAKEAAIMSIPFLRPKSTISSSSFSVRVGRSMLAPGRFMFFLSPSLMLFLTMTLIPP